MYVYNILLLILKIQAIGIVRFSLKLSSSEDKNCFLFLNNKAVSVCSCQDFSHFFPILLLVETVIVTFEIKLGFRGFRQPILICLPNL